ncbi:hypothetical protein ACWT_6110 [Actinoplanes sp. SE50]|uniref:phosphopantetheine-binding protein n=1 Tax=unclassified Actinoplanes TaxID=2626549 RepID=UPI00023ECBAF|nr:MULTISPECIES: phosphopantetheine-binding protein [unclassified Actinoplanes]AEV87127.1 hypothetical protein ACPL_6242 [Actinoplanes sp. SE50/110]ATO85525.1 hypothetical protein ACWT_6110 [Actinoplanes sp. SE50]SLM02938.1 hypothetical protein ACSP50_6223 [Actinoplanes sp. SE50/110]
MTPDLDPSFVRLLQRSLGGAAEAEPLHPDADLRALGLDSMGIIGLLVDLEEEFGVSFPDHALTFATFATPRTLWSALAELRSPVDGLA